MNVIVMRRAFTLIEIMIVILIISLITVFAAPAYTNYMIKSKLTDGSNSASYYKNIVAEHYARYGSFPEAADVNIGTGFIVSDSASEYVDHVKMKGGAADGTARIVFEFDAAKLDLTAPVRLVYWPTIANDRLTWKCGPSGSTDSAGNTEFFPTSCQEVAP